MPTPSTPTAPILSCNREVLSSGFVHAAQTSASSPECGGGHSGILEAAGMCIPRPRECGSHRRRCNRSRGGLDGECTRGPETTIRICTSIRRNVGPLHAHRAVELRFR